MKRSFQAFLDSNQPGRYFLVGTDFLGQPKVQEAFDGKQHPKNIWFHGS
jgi:hypothetical protein